MYVMVHTLTVVENDWVIQTQFLQTNDPRNADIRMIARRVIFRVYPVKAGKKHAFKPNLKTVFKKKLPNIRHHVRAVKMYDFK